ncbi:MAG: type IX secretion system sortase PorU [Chlorobi bacterium]|nr:type IX secretion system sortase PorU [Chlorobiota bacterium]
MKRFLLLAGFIVPLLLTGQTVVPVTLNWSEMQSVRSSVTGGNYNYYYFDGSTNMMDYGALPVFSYVVDLPAEYFHSKISFKILDADTLTRGESALMTDNDLLSDSVSYLVEYNGQKALIYLVPMYKTDDGGERVVRLKNFELFIDYVPYEPEGKRSVSAEDYATSSVLSSGTWFRMGIVNTGVYKLTYDDLIEMGVDPSQVNPAKIGIYGNYNGLLPEANEKPAPDDLNENSIIIQGEADGKFDKEDYILFYANGPLTWKYNVFTGRFDHTTNIYADTVYYFFTPDMGTGKRMASEENLSAEPTVIVNSFFDNQVHEKDLESLMKSGREWFGERFTGDTTERTFSFDFPNIRTDRPVYLNFQMAGRNFVDSYIDVFAGEKRVLDSVIINRVSPSSSNYALLQKRKTTFLTNDDQIVIKVKYYSDDLNAIAWLNFIELNAERELIFTGGQMGFRDPHASASGNIARFEVRGNIQNARVWDVSDIHNPKEVEFEISGDTLLFTQNTDILKDFIIFDGSEFYSPVEYLPVPNQNLHSISEVNLVIVSPEMFLPQAERIAALHQQYDGLQYVIVTPQQIYNEFSSGSQDVSAIRNFMRMLWKRDAFDSQPGYLLLLGDASFDYKYRVPENTNIVPTYESENSLRETQSYVTDDFFGLLDDDEGSAASGNLDIGIGRFPVSTPEMATIVVNKIEHYMTKDLSVMRDWRTKLCFVADDGDKNLHLKQAKTLISIADTLHPGFNINKIFSDAFPKVKIPGGERFPEVNKQINKQVEAGSLIMNYTGHGGLIGWSDELILDVPTIRAYDNINNLPLFITATCEFSRYDNPEFVSAGEYVILNENGGGIGLLTTTRLAYAHANFQVNMRVYNNLLKREDGKRPRLGDIVRMSKIPSNKNFLNFVLLGDPALRLAYPQYDIKTSSLTNKSTGGIADTVSALSLVNVSGEVVDETGNRVENFNGYIYPKVYDKPSVYMTLGTNDGSIPAEFTLSDKIIYSGVVTVRNGEFSFTFMVPRDISYNYGFGKISYYAVDTANLVDAWGAYDELLIGGYDDNAENDGEGPEINLYLNNRNFESGDIISTHPKLFAEISDEQGINFTGHSLGRDITLVMDDDMANTMVMNDYFRLDVNSYQSGRLSYQFNSLPNGWHTLSLKAWDLENNSSEKTIEFYVDEYADISLANVMNYPNPFKNETHFTFTHNKNGEVLEVNINIFDINGRFVRNLNKKVNQESLQTAVISWDGRNYNGNPVPAGIYFYTLIVTDNFGNETVQYQKMIKMSD